MARPPNRIRELRLAARLSADEVGRRAGTTGQTITRLEKGPEDGGMELTVTWMRRLAPVLDVEPIDLISNAFLAGAENEVELDDDEPLAPTLAVIGKRVYKITPQGKSMTGAGYAPGDQIVVDETPERINDLRVGDTVLVRISSPDDGVDALVLRQYLPPDLLIRNCPGSSLNGRISDPHVQIVGVLVPKK